MPWPSGVHYTPAPTIDAASAHPLPPTAFFVPFLIVCNWIYSVITAVLMLHGHTGLQPVSLVIFFSLTLGGDVWMCLWPPTITLPLTLRVYIIMASWCYTVGVLAYCLRFQTRLV
jgi:hypothetical protein